MRFQLYSLLYAALVFIKAMQRCFLTYLIVSISSFPDIKWNLNRDDRKQYGYLDAMNIFGKGMPS